MQHHTINYIELLSKDLDAAKRFYTNAFGWTFKDYGPAYTAFEGVASGVSGGFAKGVPVKGSILLIIYSDMIEATKAQITACGGNLVKDIFHFPGGRRFHFLDPDGNELAVWSDK